jgi:hypothetical protein
MQRIDIGVPDLNDSFSRVVLDGVQYLIRFTWNDTAQRWSFGLFTMQREPLAQGIRLVPRFPLNLQIVDDNFPQGIFGVYSDLDNVGRNDFINGKAAFSYISGSQE